MLLSLPHARGGVSMKYISVTELTSSSPRSWGCFQESTLIQYFSEVFPTLVGVFPHNFVDQNPCVSLPHARGGVSRLMTLCGRGAVSSPRSWGCFLQEIYKSYEVVVFPTLVGVFPSVSCATRSLSRLPHARGGVSGCQLAEQAAHESSPRSWGCFLMPDLSW